MTAVTSATPASGTVLGKKNLDKDGNVRMEIVEDFGQKPQISFRITATVLLEDDDFGKLVAAFTNNGNPRDVVLQSTATRTKQFVAMTPVKPRIDSTGTRGTGGVPNDLVTTDFASVRATTHDASTATWPHQYTVHTEVYLKSLSDSDRKQLIADIGTPNVSGIVKLLARIGEDVDENELTALLTAALS